MSTCLITGCEGFIGSHLADLLVEKGIPVIGMIYGDTYNINHLHNKIDTHECDMKDQQKVEGIIKTVKPDFVYHLAAQSFVTVSWDDPDETLRSNVLGSFYLLEAIKKYSPDAKVLVVGSSAVYGPRDETELPLGEETSFKPTSMYAVSKIAEESLGYFYGRVFGMHVIRVRPFNMTGPRKTYDACSDFAKGIVEVERGSKECLEVGNLETIRDFTDGRDAVKALHLLTEKGKPGDLYNLCSGKPRKIRDILDKYISLCNNNVQYKIVPERSRTFDDPIYVGDNSKLVNLGWKPEIPIDRTLSDMLDWWRNNL